MTSITELRKVLELLEAQGHGDQLLAAGHDVIHLLPHYCGLEPESPAGQEFKEKFNACYTLIDGWFIYV